MIPALVALAANIVPALAGHLFGKTGETVTTAVIDAAKSVFGTDNPDAITAAISKDPALALAFKSELLKIQEAAARRSHELMLAEIEDAKSARSLYRDASQSAVNTLALITVAAFFLINGLLLYGYYLLLTDGVRIINIEIALAVANAVGVLAGFINSKAELVYGFFFGSSMSGRANSMAATAALNDVAKQAARK